MVLHDAVEKHREKATMDQSRRAFVDQREGDCSRSDLAVEVIEAVLRKARVERADVCRVIEVDAPPAIVVGPDPRRAVRRNRPA